MFRSSNRVGFVVVLLLLVDPANAAPPLYAPVPLKGPSLPRETAPLPASVTRPVLTGVTPARCVSPGDSLVVRGRNLGQRGARQLVMDTGQQRFPLSIKIWKSTQISTRLPSRFSHRGKVEIGIRSVQGWQGAPLPVIICRTVTGTRTSGQDQTPTLPLAPAVPVPANVPGTPSSNQSSPEAPAPVRAGSGTLLGTALPPVPEALRLIMPDKKARQYAPHELVAVTSSMDEAKQLAQIMMAYQARVVRRHTLASLGMVLSAFRLPDKASIPDVLMAIRREFPDLWVDVNHYFRPSAGRGQRDALYRAIDYTPDLQCGRGLRIGLLDGPAELGHPALNGQSIIQKVMFARGRPAASTQHATAVVSLLVGNPAVAGLGGVVSEANLYVGVVMQQGENDDVFSTAEDLLAGLAWLLDQPVQVISLSLGGPRNALLEIALQRTLAMGIGIVAAAGNGEGDPLPVYPAAQTGVLAVTSVDSDGVIAQDASRGDYIDLAAPGVDVWVASGKSDGRYVSGTSMAAPLVAAALAELGGSPFLATQLFQQARDLGEPGKDAVYGWGMLRFPVCAGEK